MKNASHSGPLAGTRVLEFAGLGPAPFCGMLLADLGADVVRIDRPGGADYRPEDVETRGRASIVLDLKKTAERDMALALAGKADILLEGFRPGVMEKLGLGPDTILAQNPALVYGRITGWGQSGPLASQAGHDLNYLALTGALHAMGTAEKPAIPLNLVADFGGGAMYLMMGLLAALYHARNTGTGQVVDAAMCDGVISLMNMIYGDFHAGTWTDTRANNVIDGAAPFYNVYRCADGKWLSLACIEPVFYRAFVDKAGLEQATFGDQWDRQRWPDQRAALAALFERQSRDAWIAHFAGHDVCIAPVLSLAEARQHPHNRARHNFQDIDGVTQAGAQPGFSMTPAQTPFGVHHKDADRQHVLSRWRVKDGQ